LREEAKR
jgi:hypothetical protein